MPQLTSWILAARLRTLPLSISGILVGAGMALREGFFEWKIFVLALLTTLGFQVLSNFANDYGDGVKGTDMKGRVGPARALQSGLLSAQDLKIGIIITATTTLLSSIILIYTAFGQERLALSLLYFLLGLSAIIAAITYTVGKSAYGYRGLGDVFVFIFFGLVGVMGSYFLFTQRILILNFLPAISIGLLSVAVLHLNNMRDREADALVGKNTLAVILGKKGARRYHVALIITALLCWLLYILFLQIPYFVITCFAFLPLLIHLKKVFVLENHSALDPELKVVALCTFVLSSLFFGISWFI